MSSFYGENIHIAIFGQSHSAAIGVTIDGIPAGGKVDTDRLQAFLARRAPGRNAFSTARREADRPELVCGIKDGFTCGAPITALIHNTNTISADYKAMENIPRPGHADYTAEIKYGGYQDKAGGGHFSGRLTAPLCIAGGICLQLLEEEGIRVYARVFSIGGTEDRGCLSGSIGQKTFPVADDERGREMQQLIADAKAEGDSVGGIVECGVFGLPAGLGDPIFGGMENRISQAVFGIPAVKGIEFGAGFGYASMRGSRSNDAFAADNGEIKTLTNNCGGILGGITNGMPLIFRAAFKPTPSIAMAQTSVDLASGRETELRIKGRHDPCIVPRAVPCVEAAAAIAVYDALLGRRKERL